MRAFDFYNNIIPCGIEEFFPRAYYLLGWNNEQFAVYYGQEYPTSSCEIGCVGGGAANITSTGPRTVLMWNAEYNTYGNGSNINLTYKYNSDGTWKKYYNINDRLGNVRTVLRKDGTAGTVVKQFFYTPFGSVIPLLGNVNRTKFIGKEKDKESNYGDFGVRKYDDEIGRFTSIDPLWELDYSWTPYHYSYNNPILFTDGNGMQPGVLTQTIKDVSKLIGPAAVAIGTNPQVQKAAEKSLDYIKEKVNQLDNFLSNGGYENSENYPSENIIQTDATSVSPQDPIILKDGEGNTNPYEGAVDKPVTVVDPAGNAIPVGKGEQIKTSPNGKWVDVKDSEGNPTGKRIDQGHKPGPKHPDPKGWEPHGHVPGVTNPDGTPWLPIRNVSQPK